MENPLIYVPAEVPDDCKIRISPSSFGHFVLRPWVWYRQQILGLDKFEYSTSSVLGTIVHYVAETVALNNEVSEDYIEKYIELHEENDQYCKETVRSQWLLMAETLVNTYTLPNQDNILEVEKMVRAEIGDGVYAAGTLDLLEGIKEDCMLTDYKSYNSKSKPKSFSPEYKYQLLVYAWILRELGYHVTRLRLVFINRNIDGGLSEKTGKPLKSYPPEVTILTEVITEEDFDFISSQLLLCKETLAASEVHPELRHVIWHDGRLRDA